VKLYLRLQEYATGFERAWAEIEQPTQGHDSEGEDVAIPEVSEEEPRPDLELSTMGNDEVDALIETALTADPTPNPLSKSARNQKVRAERKAAKYLLRKKRRPDK